MERFGYDVHEADAEKAMGSVYVLVREQVRSEFGVFREPVPPQPAWCDYKNSEAHSKAMQTWQERACGLERWTTDEQLHEYLNSPISKKELVSA
jgi:hypothetical protein